MSDYEISVRQPAAGDIIGTTIQIAAVGTAFEASYGWKLTTGGQILAEGYFQGGGSSGLMASFVRDVPVEGVSFTGAATFEFHGDTGNESPTPVSVPVVVVPGSTGFVPYRVKKGDTLTKIAASRPYSSDIPTIENIGAVNQLVDNDYIEEGQLLRIPV